VCNVRNGTYNGHAKNVGKILSYQTDKTKGNGLLFTYGFAKCTHSDSLSCSFFVELSKDSLSLL